MTAVPPSGPRSGPTEGPPGRIRAASCSRLADAAGSPVFGTAPLARFWVVIVQEGGYGRDAATQSHLDPVLGADLAARCLDHGGRLLLVRTVSERASAADARRAPTGRRTAFVAWAGDSPWLTRLTLDDPADLRSMDWAALAVGSESALAGAADSPLGSATRAPADPILLVCTNGRRDACCAERGRAVALAAEAASPHEAGRPGRVWESSHLGGHRFAPTAVLLPYGHFFGRLSPALGADVLEAADAGRLPTELLGAEHDRGRSAISQMAQAAESFVRAELGEDRLDVFGSRAVGADRVEVTHRDGRRWDLRLAQALDGERPESCGKAPVPAYRWRIITTV